MRVRRALACPMSPSYWYVAANALAQWPEARYAETSLKQPIPPFRTDPVMARKYAVQYIDRLLDGETYHDLVELSSIMCSSSQYTSQAPDYGLPTFAFLFAETLQWFAQSIRSGVWTYYEATPVLRQRVMAAALRAHATPEFADWYERGMTGWKDEQRIRAVDDWIEANDNAANAWLRLFARENREALLAMS